MEGGAGEGEAAEDEEPDPPRERRAAEQVLERPRQHRRVLLHQLRQYRHQ